MPDLRRHTRTGAERAATASSSMVKVCISREFTHVGDEPHLAGDRLPARPRPPPARRARRPRRRGDRDVLQRRVRAGDDGRRHVVAPGAQPAVAAVRRSARPAPPTSGCHPTTRSSSPSGPPPGARCWGCASPATSSSAPASTRCARCSATRSSPSSSRARKDGPLGAHRAAPGGGRRARARLLPRAPRRSGVSRVGVGAWPRG